MGVNDAHNTVGENVGAYNTAWVLLCQGGRRVLFPALVFLVSCWLPQYACFLFFAVYTGNVVP